MRKLNSPGHCLDWFVSLRLLQRHRAAYSCARFVKAIIGFVCSFCPLSCSAIILVLYINSAITNLKLNNHVSTVNSLL